MPTSLTRTALFLLLLGLAALSGRDSLAATGASAVSVNGAPLSAQALQWLSQRYGALQPGSYWYDPTSGLWGQWGGPTAGQIQPGLRLGGPLPRNASGGGTGVFINGREIHPQEYLYLRSLYGTVVPGRYWLNAQMVGGFEGGPPAFNLRTAASRAGGGGGGGGYNRNTAGGGLMSDGGCSGYLHPGGATVMTGNC